LAKTISEINRRIKDGEAVVVTAEEIIDIVGEKGPEKAAKEVDVVTTGTFGPMCSSGMFINIGHSKPRIKLGGGRVTLNGVEAYAGLAAVDLYIGATALPPDDPRNRAFPGEFAYGGGHVIQDLVSRKDLELRAQAYGTDCYPRRDLHTLVNLDDINEAVLVNPRNCYQNYNVAVNTSDKTIYTYMGVLKPNLGNANYCSAGQLSPLLNDPLVRTIGIGTRIFLGGGVGYVYWQGTQHNPNVERTPRGVPRSPAATLAVAGDLKQMSPEFLVGTSFLGYGATLTVGLGIPIPILDAEMAQYAAVSDSDIVTKIVDYATSYPQSTPGNLGEVDYATLRSGHIKVGGKKVPTASLSSYAKARKIALTLKKWIEEGRFLLSEPVQLLPTTGSDVKFKPLRERAPRVSQQ